MFFTVPDSFAVIAEPTRRRILDLLRARPASVGELVTSLALPQPAVSKHLRVLREAGVVSAEVDAQRRVYRVEPAGLADALTWIAPYRELWNRSLDRLEAHLDSLEDR